MDGVVEIITGRERRRRWSLQDKVRIVAESSKHPPRTAVLTGADWREVQAA